MRAEIVIGNTEAWQDDLVSFDPGPQVFLLGIFPGASDPCLI
jgi:hypothetical protein